MKFINKTLGILSMMSGMLIGFSGCTEEVDYTPAEKLNGAQIYFPTTMASQIDLSNTETSFIVEVSRANTDSDITANLNVTNESGLFTIPTSVNFAAGESTAKLSIGYDPEALGFDNYQTITIAIADETYTTPYGTSTYTFKVGIPAPWTSLGTAIFYDNFLFMYSYPVELQQNDLNPSTYRLVDPYSEGLATEGYPTEGAQSEYVEFTLLKPGEKLNDITITMEGLVYFPAYCTGFFNTSNDYNQNVDVHHPSDFTDFQGEAYWTYNKVLQYQEDGTPAIVQLAPFYYMDGIGGWNYSTTDGMIKIVFPGVTETDYSIGVAYAGKYTDSKGNDKGILAQLTTVGGDVESIRLAVVEGTDVATAVEGIVNGSIDYMEVGPEAASNTIMIPFASTPVDGDYTLVAIAYGGNEAQTSSSATFKYASSTTQETWTAINVGDYTYTLFFGTAEEPAVDSGLTLFRSNENPNRYKIEHWGYDVDFIFTYNAETGEVVVEEQETGYTHPSYGMVMISDLVPYTGGQEYGYSYYENGVFHFAVVYFVSEGEFALGEETFAITGEAGTNSAATRSMSMPSGKANKKVNVAAPKFSRMHIKSVKNMIPWSK